VKLAALVMVMLVTFLPTADALQPGPSKIKLTGTVVETMNKYQRIYSLWNKPTYQQRLGTGFQLCVPFGDQYTDCYLTLRLGRGQIVARGVSPTVSGFRQLAVVGGTGYYENVGGEVTMQSLGPATVLILVDLRAF